MKYIEVIKSYIAKRKILTVSLIVLFSILCITIVTDSKPVKSSEQTPLSNSKTEQNSFITSIAPKIESRNVFDIQELPYTSSKIQSPSITKGTEVIQTTGKVGRRVITYEVRYISNKEISRTMLSDLVTVQPVNEVIAVGTKTSTSSCKNGVYTSINGREICVTRPKKPWRDWF